MSTQSNVVALSHADASSHAVVGGKGANLGKLSQQGYPVPPAFVITTAAYSQFLLESGLKAVITGLLAEIDYDNLNVLEDRTARIRERVEAATVPASLIADIGAAYAAMGTGNLHVAVRSSGTAEDLAGTSFAGLHDTYLDVLGIDEVIDATKRCWASLWSARATGYRQGHGFDHFDALLAVVVQKMVAADVAGVMFTANPRTSATDETMINATWGLGESLVQGSITPDEYVVMSDTLQVLERTIGDKAHQIVRNPETGRGVVTQEVSPESRKAAALTDAQIGELTKLGRRITAQYDGYPQDIEWAIEGGTLYLLQSRPITGVDFSWDDVIDAWQPAADDPFVIRTRVFADEIWTGPITPLTYSVTAPTFNAGFYDQAEILGNKGLLKHRLLKYHRGTVYWNCDFEQALIKGTLSFSRASSLQRLPESWHKDATVSSFGLVDYLKQQARIFQLVPKMGPYAWMDIYKDYLENRMEEVKPLSKQQLRDLSDEELEKHIDKQQVFLVRYVADLLPTGFCYYFRDSICALAWMTQHWYDGKNPGVFADLMTGTPHTTKSIIEHIELARIAQSIRASTAILESFKSHPGAAFFAQLQNSDEGRAVAKGVEAFLELSGHRGQSDRDLIFPCYVEDRSVLYNALEVHLKSEDDPMEMWERNHNIRNAAYEDVLQNLSRQALGFLKAEAFKVIHDYVMKASEVRDNQRHFVDRHLLSMKISYLDVNRRLMERGLIDGDRDFYMLTRDELFDVLRGKANMTLVRHKIAGRMKNWSRFERKEVSMPKFLQRNAGMKAEITDNYDAEGHRVLQGFGTSRGEVTATARVIKSLKEINRLNKGEILIANSTDPGWTPVFAAISGVIVETGGILSHAGCLAREYGFPAAHIEHAISLIPDGATIRLNGENGTVVILDAGNG